MADTLTRSGFVPLATDDDDGRPDSPSAALAHSQSSLLHQVTHAPKLTLLNGLALVIGLQIGSGIFTVPSVVTQFVTSPGWGLVVWLLAGALVWTGAASFIELGLRVPSNGGIQEYLRTSYGGSGDFMGFLFTWTWVAIAKPAANSVIGTIAASYLTRPFMGDDDQLGPWVSRSIALACVWVITVVNCLGTTSGAKAANIFLVLKLSALCVIIAVGVVAWLTGGGDGVPKSETGWFGLAPEAEELPLWRWIGNFVTAIFGAVFCYGGWETVGFVLGDMANPEGDLPVVITGAMLTVIAGFCLMNAAIYICLPFMVIRASSTVSVEFAKRMLGSWAGVLFSVVVSISAMGALNANVFATARLCVAASQRTYFPRVLANLHCLSVKDEAEYLDRKFRVLPSLFRDGVTKLSRWTETLRWQRSVPIYALILNAVLTSLYIIIGSFNGLVTLIGLAEYSCFFFAVLGLLLLRRREARQLSQTVQTGSNYSTWIGNPIIFTVVSGLLILRGVMSDPLQGLAIGFVVFCGMAVFYLKFGLRGFGAPVSV